MKITWFGHSAFRLEFGSSVVLIDPFLTGNGSFKGTVEEASKGATHVVLTHGHGDHTGDTAAIANATGAKVVANAELCQYFGRKDLKKLDPMNTGGTTDQGEFTVSLTIAFHSSAAMDENGVLQDLGLPNGVVITPKDQGQPTVYHMGDTDVFSDMALIGEMYRPKVAMVPMGDRFTMGARGAALAMRRFLPDVPVVVPCHYATFPILAQSADDFVREMGDQGQRVRVVKPGEAFEV
ncbi:metal-dependent hydrolase [Roseomonas harenae]|uniref:metal-dependent hydrolase n=1 Tax=Muricoccus harenae TaxID=2692566 RepID=UPI00133193F5|nr:metal-dependent hydrolase [Roseomonas harenae]